MPDYTNIKALAESLEIPASLYETAERRYEDLSSWLSDKSKSKCAQFIPEIYPQGSFRLGTVVKPLVDENYDLDIVCNLTEGISVYNCSQYQLKSLLNYDLENYRKERNIEQPLEEKHRCWRLNYKDAIGFHMDQLPSIPHEIKRRQLLKGLMVKYGTDDNFAEKVSGEAIAITDNKHKRYREIFSDWQVSNPKGYALWFESRMRQAPELLKSIATMEKVTSIDVLPVFRWKTPLQKAIQILKRRRDIMFKDDNDRKPISIIITTLAALAYSGEQDVESALNNILANMKSFVNAEKPRVPNPVNPEEDFADKWYSPEGIKLQLEENFNAWLIQVKADLKIISTASDSDSLQKSVMEKFGTSIDKSRISSLFGASIITQTPETIQVINESRSVRPWFRY